MRFLFLFREIIFWILGMFIACWQGFLSHFKESQNMTNTYNNDATFYTAWKSFFSFSTFNEHHFCTKPEGGRTEPCPSSAHRSRDLSRPRPFPQYPVLPACVIELDKTYWSSGARSRDAGWAWLYIALTAGNNKGKISYDVEIDLIL